MGVGVAFAWSASSYTLGKAARMGAGYFPLALGAVLALLGGVILYKALVVETVDGDKLRAFAWRPLVLIVAANLAFGVLLAGVPSIQLPPMGLMAAVYAMTLLCCWAAADVKWLQALLLATLLAATSYLVCISVLHLGLPVWPPFVPA